MDAITNMAGIGFAYVVTLQVHNNDAQRTALRAAADGEQGPLKAAIALVLGVRS